MKAFSKRVLSLTMAMAMVGSVVSVPNVDAEAATGLNVKSKTTYVGVTTALKLKTPSTWKSVKTTWTTSSKAVKLTAKKAKSVKVTASKAGTATVKAKVSFKKGKKASTKTYSCKFKVAEPKLVATIDKTDLKIGEQAVLTVKKKPAKGTVKYTTSDAGVVTVSGGKVTARGIGTATVTVSLTTGKNVIEKKFDMTVIGAENGLTASLANPFANTDAYKDVVLNSNEAIINVSCVVDGKPASGEAVVLTLSNNGNYKVKGNNPVTTNSKGIATFVIGYEPTALAPNPTVTGVSYTATLSGSDASAAGVVKFSKLSYSNIDVLNNNKKDDEYPNLVPGTNYPYTTGGDALTASMDGKWNNKDYSKTDTSEIKTWDDEYVASQQVSTTGKEDHMVYIKGGYPMIEIPGSASDMSAATKKVESVNVTYGPYETYVTDHQYVEISEDPSKLTYTTLKFDYLKLSKYTQVRLATYTSKELAEKDTANKAGMNEKIYVGTQDQGAFNYEIPVNNGGKVVKITVTSKGQVDTAYNTGYKASEIEYVYKTQKTDGGAKLPVQDAKVDWSIVGTQYTAEADLKVAAADGDVTYGVNQKKIELKKGDKITEKHARFPYTGTAVLTHYDANGKVKAYYAFETTNNGDNANVLGQPYANAWDGHKGVLASATGNNGFGIQNTGICYEITADELRDQVGTIVAQDGQMVKLNSYQSGRTTLEGKVTVAGQILDAEQNVAYTSIQWNPIPNATVNDAKAYVAFVGQNIEVIAQLVDMNKNAVTKQGENISFYYTNNGANTKVAGTKVNSNRNGVKDVAVVKVDAATDSNGQAKLILKASEITGLENVTVEADSKAYDAKLYVKEVSDTYAANKADLYWVEPELAFTDRADGGQEYATNNTTHMTREIGADSTLPAADQVDIKPLSGSTWLYGVYTKADKLAKIGSLSEKSVNIDGLDIVMDKAASGVGTVEKTTKSGQVKATSAKTGKTVIVSKITPASVTDKTSVSVVDGTALFAGVGTANIGRTLKLDVQWQNNGMMAEFLTPNGTNVVSTNTIAYLKVTDNNGNAVTNTSVNFKVTDGHIVNADGTLSVSTNDIKTDGNGIATVNVQLGATDGARTTVSAEVPSIVGSSYSVIFVRRFVGPTEVIDIEKNKDDFTEKYMSTFDKTTGIITLTFTKDIVASSVVADAFKAYYVATETTDMGVESVTVNGNVISVKVANVPGTIDASKSICVSIARDVEVKGVKYTMTSENGSEFAGTVEFLADAGKTAPKAY